MKIEVKNEQDKMQISIKDIKNTIKEILKAEGQLDAGLSVLLVDDKKMRELNHRFCGIDNSTDVLAFSMREGEDININPHLLGDVVVSLETAKRCADRYKSTKKKEMYLYLVHGILHLLGYDDNTKEGCRLMNVKQKEILARVVKE